MFSNRKNWSRGLHRFTSNAFGSCHSSSCTLWVRIRCFILHSIAYFQRSIKSPLPLLSALFHNPKTLLASPIDQHIYRSLLGLNHIDIFDRWIQTHQLVPIAKPDLVYLQVKFKSMDYYLNPMFLGAMFVFNPCSYWFKWMAYTLFWWFTIDRSWECSDMVSCSNKK